MKKNVWAILILVALVGGGFVLANRNRNQSAASTNPTNSSQAISYACEEGKTAYAILAAKYPVETKETSFGKQVVAIAGTTPAPNQYWAFYVSGSLAPVGADAYTCAGNELVEWKLESF